HSVARSVNSCVSPRRLVSLCPLPVVGPAVGPFPQMSHRCAMHAPRNRFGSRETPALYSTGTHPKQTATADLRTPLQFLKGVGPRRAAQLERKGLRTVEDALFFLPLRHEDRTRL